MFGFKMFVAFIQWQRFLIVVPNQRNAFAIRQKTAPSDDCFKYSEFQFTLKSKFSIHSVLAFNLHATSD